MMPLVLPWDAEETPYQLLRALETGRTVIFPTDTVYGLGGNPWDERVLARVRTLKDRDSSLPFTLHVASKAALSRYANLSPENQRRVEIVLPGPYTALLPATGAAPRSAVQRETVGIRWPDHPLFAQVVGAIDRPVFGTSVNRHGEPPLSDPIDIIDTFSSVDLIITGPVGAASSAIIDFTGTEPRCLRGTVPSELAQRLGLQTS